MLRHAIHTKLLLQFLTCSSLWYASQTTWGAEKIQFIDDSNWAVACDNVQHCSALGVQRGIDSKVDYMFVDGKGAAILISRDAGPNTPAVVTVAAQNIDTGAASRLTILFGHLRITAFNTNANPTAAGTELSAQQFAKMKAEIPHIQNIQISDGKNKWQIPASKLNAAVRWLDERQGRAGGPDAFTTINPTRGEQIAPRAPEMPVILKATLPPTTASDLLLAMPIFDATQSDERSCDQGSQANSKYKKVIRLSREKVILLVDCDDGVSQLAWLSNGIPPFTPRPLGLPIEGSDGSDLMTERIFTEYKDGVITSDRGVGKNQCAVFRQWTWNGSDFALNEAAKHPFCNEVDPGPSLRIWTAQVISQRDIKSLR